MQKKRMSLALKLNLLIMAIVLTISLVLVGISYYSYSQTAYIEYYARIEDAEKLFAENETALLGYADVVYRCTLREGFQEAREEAIRKNPKDPELGEWLMNLYVNEDTLEIIPLEEYYEMRDRAAERARAAGVPEEQTDEWMRENTPEVFRYTSNVWNLYMDIALYFNSYLGDSGADGATLVAEDSKGYLMLAETQRRNVLGEEAGSTSPWSFHGYGDRSPEIETIDLYKQQKEHKPFRLDSNVIDVVPMEKNGVRYYLVYSCSIREAEEGQRMFLLQNLLLVGLMVAGAIAVSLILLRRMATKPLKELSKAVDEFSLGDAEEGRAKPIELDIRSHDEIGDLYQNIRAMQIRMIDDTESLTKMTAEKERISTELSLAARIQTAMLPNAYPAFPERKDFEVFATMTPARDVGGDFYGYFLIDEDHLGLVSADVSGKGIPAALFMAISKVLLENLVKTGLSPAKALTEANRQICSNNNAQMFVTVWLGILELSTGKLTAANAGHEYPVLRAPGGAYELYKDPHGLVVGGMDGMQYKDYEVVLAPGTKLFVYTDGLPEATRLDKEMFGTDRMLSALNECGEGTPEETLRHVHAAVDAFVGDAEQFDDLTMLCLLYRGTSGETSAKKA